MTLAYYTSLAVCPSDFNRWAHPTFLSLKVCVDVLKTSRSQRFQSSSSETSEALRTERSSRCLRDPDHCGATHTAFATNRGSTIFHLDLLGVLHLTALSALQTVSCHRRSPYLPWVFNQWFLATGLVQEIGLAFCVTPAACISCVSRRRLVVERERSKLVLMVTSCIQGNKIIIETCRSARSIPQLGG